MRLRTRVCRLDRTAAEIVVGVMEENMKGLKMGERISRQQKLQKKKKMRQSHFGVLSENKQRY